MNTVSELCGGVDGVLDRWRQDGIGRVLGRSNLSVENDRGRGSGTRKPGPVSNLSMDRVFVRLLVGFLATAAINGAQAPSVIDAVHKGHAVGHEQDGVAAVRAALAAGGEYKWARSGRMDAVDVGRARVPRRDREAVIRAGGGHDFPGKQRGRRFSKWRTDCHPDSFRVLHCASARGSGA